MEQVATGTTQPVRLRGADQPNPLIPILWLVAILAGSFILGLVGGVIVLILAAMWVYSDTKKRGIGKWLWVWTLLFAILALPFYAYRLHQLQRAVR